MLKVTMTSRRGFTLTELLVALAIMVILFALLFAPMMAGLDMVSTGRANAGMQDACRLALEQIGRELGEAVYVRQSHTYLFDPDSTPNSGDEYGVVNPSIISFNPPARDGMGKVYHPPRPAFETVRDGSNDGDYQKIVRYRIHLVDPSAEHDDFNPFALYRQEFLYNPRAADPIGNFVGAVWQPGALLCENIMTPKRGATFVPSTSVCLDCSDTTRGYVQTCGSCGSTRISYIFDGLQFRPRRIVGEQLRTNNGVVYKAVHSGWDGTAWTGLLPSFALARTPLDPRISVYAWDPATASHSVLRLDSYQPGARPVQVRWSADGGTVTAGQQRTSLVNFTAPAPQRVAWYAVAPSADTTPLWASTGPAPTDEANGPIGLSIDPSVGTGQPALIEQGTLKVRVIADAGTVHREIDLKPTGNIDQKTIAGDEFQVRFEPHEYTPGQWGTLATIRFSRFDPPRPTSYALFGANPPAITSFQIQITYYARRNYTYDPGYAASGQAAFVNDAVKVDYSVRSIQDVTLTLQQYTDLVDDGSGALVVPSDETPPMVSMSRQVIARNFGY